MYIRRANMKEEKALEIQPQIRKRQGTSKMLTLSLSEADIEDMFQSFIRFIDASPNTIRTYSISLQQWFNYLRLNQVHQPTSETVFQYRDDLKRQGKRATTIQNYIIAVRQFFKWTDATGLYPNIAKYIKGAKIGKNFKKDYLTSKQAKKVLSIIDRTTLTGKRDYAMLAIMLTMGLRTVEVIRANIEDIKNAGENTVLYVQGKGHIEKDDSVRMPAHVEEAVREYLTARGEKDITQPLFISTSNRNKKGRMTTRSIRRIVKQYFIKAGYDSPRLTAHSTRHTAATLSLMHGATLEQTQHLLRHKNMQTTEIYAHNIDAAKNPASQDVDNALFS